MSIISKQFEFEERFKLKLYLVRKIQDIQNFVDIKISKYNFI